MQKTKTGNVRTAARDLDLDLRKCWMIGDTPLDILAGKNAGCRTIQVLTGKDKTESEDADFLAEDLYTATYFLS